MNSIPQGVDVAIPNPDQAVLNILIAALQAGQSLADTLPILLRADPSLARATIAQSDDPQTQRLYSEDEIDELPAQQWAYTADGVQIPDEGLTLLAGPSGKGKSFVTTDWALQKAQSDPVVYVAAEKFRLYAERKQAWYRHHKARSKGNLHFYDGSIDLMKPQATADFINLIRPLQPRMVIIDTLARCMVGGDENSAQDMGLFIQGCETVKKELKCAVIVVHHTGKNGTGERGSSALRGACDCVIELSNDDGQITLTNTKQSGGAEFEPVHMRLLPVDLGDGRSSCAVVPSEKVTDDPAITGYLTGKQLMILEGFTGYASLPFNRIMNAVEGKMSRGAVHKTLGKLVQLGYIGQDATGEPYWLTPKGKAAINE